MHVKAGGVPGERTEAPPIRVLVAEDNADLRGVLARLIDSEPDLACVGAVATTGTLLDALAELAPDALVLDLVLQGATTLPLVDRVRAAHPLLRIVLYSGYLSSMVIREARRRGATACVAKADEYDYLFDAIRGFGPPPGG